MADQLYLSYWLRGFTGPNMLRHFQKLLSVFPFSTLSPRAPILRIYAIEDLEPPIFERSFDWTSTVDTVIESAAEFRNPDCCYLVEAYWDLWRFDADWKLTPSQVTLACLGPLFRSDLGDHLRIEFGPDSDFLPQLEIPDGASKVQSNIKGLLRLVHQLDEVLPVDKRRLWSETGEDFVERLQAVLS